jgi:uncharacterized protein YecT (DUF1311 family)
VNGCLAFSSGLAQSFDCKNAATTVEHAICDDEKLATLDVQLANNLRRLFSTQPKMRATYLENEREWMRDRDHHCTAPGAEQSLNDCLVAEYTARLADIFSRARLGAVRRAHTPLCQVIADRYHPLANSHPGEAPLNVLGGSPTSGIRLAKTTEWVELHSTDLAAWAAAQKPPFSISPALLNTVKQY